MSEEVLQALTRLFAILSRQGGSISQEQITYVREYLEHTLAGDETELYFQLFLQRLEPDAVKGAVRPGDISPLDSVDVIGHCYQMNETLHHDQKIIVLAKCLELVHGGTPFPESTEVLKTCSDIFNISSEDFHAISLFTRAGSTDELHTGPYLLIGDDASLRQAQKHLSLHLHHASIAILHIKSADLLFARMFGTEQVQLNGNILHSSRIYAVPIGSVIHTLANAPLYYSTLSNAFRESGGEEQIRLTIKDLEYHFDDGKIGLRRLNFSAQGGEMVAVMGGSGSGKSTLLGLLSGILEPSAGSIELNGLRIGDRQLSGRIGYVSQDDLLIEELTVFENLYYNSRLIFGELSKGEILERIDRVLEQLQLSETHHLRVGSVHEKVLSGGQRKRLNIGLELIRNPAVLFLDEPISGLSSKDSENVMALLADLRQTGRLIFVVIHQPSSDIYKLFDHILLIDKGGYCVYSGHPIKALSYFRETGKKIKKEATHCLACGNVHVQEIFDIIEEKVLDEYGAETAKRKRLPQQWYERFKEYNTVLEEEQSPVIHPPLPGSPEIKPSTFQQFLIYLRRNLRSKLANPSYVALLFLEPLVLGLILSFLIRRSPADDYLFSDNSNIPAYVFMSIIVIIFIGLTMSAEEIHRDRKILYREQFLELSRLAYAASKIALLAAVSAVQTWLFVAVGNFVLDIKGNFLIYWIMLFTLACNASLIGLNISAAFRSAVSIYIMIPLLIIPQMILGGAMFNYDDLHPSLDKKGYAPLIASVIPARWAYEGLLFAQFRYNPYQDIFYPTDAALSHCRYLNGAFLSELYDLIDKQQGYAGTRPCGKECHDDYNLIMSEIAFASMPYPDIRVSFEAIGDTIPVTPESAHMLKNILEQLSEKYQHQYNRIVAEKNEQTDQIKKRAVDIDELKSAYHNFRTESLVRNALSDIRVIRENNRLVRISEPVYLAKPEGSSQWRNIYLSPYRKLAGISMSTYAYNILVIWLYSAGLFLLLYGDGLRRLFHIFNRITIFSHHSRSNYHD